MRIKVIYSYCSICMFWTFVSATPYVGIYRSDKEHFFVLLLRTEKKETHQILWSVCLSRHHKPRAQCRPFGTKRERNSFYEKPPPGFRTSFFSPLRIKWMLNTFQIITASAYNDCQRSQDINNEQNGRAVASLIIMYKREWKISLFPLKGDRNGSFSLFCAVFCSVKTFPFNGPTLWGLEEGREGNIFYPRRVVSMLLRKPPLITCPFLC